MKISKWANNILGKSEFAIASDEVSLNLVLVSVRDLGFAEGATGAQIYARARERGLELCPAEVGLQLRLQYRDQPKNEWILVGMEPIAHSDGRPGVFYLGHNEKGVWLRSIIGSTNFFWSGDRRWVFVRSRAA